MPGKKAYRYISLNRDKSEENEASINEAAREGFEILEVVQGFRTTDLSYRFAAVIMVKDCDQ